MGFTDRILMDQIAFEEKLYPGAVLGDTENDAGGIFDRSDRFLAASLAGIFTGRNFVRVFLTLRAFAPLRDILFLRALLVLRGESSLKSPAAWPRRERFFPMRCAAVTRAPRCDPGP